MWAEKRLGASFPSSTTGFTKGDLALLLSDLGLSCSGFDQCGTGQLAQMRMQVCTPCPKQDQHTALLTRCVCECSFGPTPTSVQERHTVCHIAIGQFTPNLRHQNHRWNRGRNQVDLCSDVASVGTAMLRCPRMCLKKILHPHLGCLFVSLVCLDIT